MKKILLLCLVLSMGFSYKAFSKEMEYVNEIYYHSTLLCPEDKPIKKVDNCMATLKIILHGFYTGDDWLNWDTMEKCKIPSDQLEWIRKIHAETEEKREAFDKDYSEISRVKDTLKEHYRISMRGICFISEHPRKIDRSQIEYKGDCSKEDIIQWREYNESSKNYNDKTVEKKMEEYGQNCFSCDDEVDFLTDKQTCDFCPNREMKGALCIKKEIK